MRDPFRTYKTAWVDFCMQVGAEYTSYTHNLGARAVVTDGPWKIVFTDYRTDIAGDVMPHTILAADYVTTRGLRFGLHRSSVVSRLLDFTGLHDIRTGDPQFDSAYVLKGNDAETIRTLFSDDELRGLLVQAPPLHIGIVDHEGWYTRRHTPEQGHRAPHPRSDVDVLYGHIEADIWDKETLVALNRIMSAILHGMVRSGAATDEDASPPLGAG